ncbi:MULTISPECIES: flagellar motor protein MotB [unclassified Sphingobium]|uniref:flagellar motor protein MotB n=1 Tax=unclassified Sphingobium TaxID=2611147 RepID=UPI0022243869|nr:MULTISPECIES: flagellar motor protein MotB [unclassified Sphingobium]MCW2412458.1 chemotaxis protein MotB [Sphingobium sp. B8D3D]MCW2415245.1 chemotaxis protein MotB [Sphingobium sp. B8D3A]
MASAAKKPVNEPEPRPIIVKKIIDGGHGGHHGGAWKVAYADFVTAMMAFFLLMWLLGATTEKQRKGLADYFTPTLVQMKMDSAGSSGMFGGDSLVSKENYPTTGGQGNLAITIPRDATGTKDVGGEDLKNQDRQKFEKLKQELEQKLERTEALRKLRKHVRFTETLEGLRIDLVDEADFAMFAIGTDKLVPEARALLSQVAEAVSEVPNDVIVRGHTDALPYAAGRNMNNWLLSSSRAEATRAVLAQGGIGGDRFARIEGVADREPFVADNRYDPRNRRMSVILAWSKDSPAGGAVANAADAQPAAPAPKSPEQAKIDRRILVRDQRVAMAESEVRKLDLGRTALPQGATVINADSIPKRSSNTPPGKTDLTARTTGLMDQH